MKTMKDLLNDLGNQLHKNDNGKVVLKDGSDETWRDVIRDCHDGMLPDDQRYQMIKDLCDTAEGHDDVEEDDYHDWVEGALPIETYRLTTWLASRADRIGYVNETLAEMPEVTEGFAMMQISYRKELDEVASALLSAINDHFGAEFDDPRMYAEFDDADFDAALDAEFGAYQE